VFDYAGGKADWLAAGFSSEGEVASEPRAGAHTEKVLTCRIDNDAADVRGLMVARGLESCVVVQENRTVLGRLHLRDVGAELEGRVEHYMQPGPSTFRPSVPLSEMVDYMRERDMTEALITTSDGILIGILNRHEAEHALKRYLRGGDSGTP